MDILRTCIIKNMNLEIGLPVTYCGEKIGKVISNIGKDCEVAVNSSMVNRIINSCECSFSLEVKG